MDAASIESTEMSTEADASHVMDDSAANSEDGTETKSAQDAFGGTDFQLNTTHDEHTENEFKSPIIIPLSLLTSTSKKKHEISEKEEEVVQQSSKYTSSDANAEFDNKYINSEALENKDTEVLANKSSVSYEEPEWSGKPEGEYSFDVLKNGSIIDTVSLKTRSFYVFGRLPSCDVTLEHPSLSRYHAVLQYNCISTPSREKGWYVYDLDSTHGTWVNKKKISPKVYHRLRVGHIVKFGGSSRLHILQGPAEDIEDESELTVTELKEQREKLQKETELLRQIEVQEKLQRQEAEQKLLEDRGCGWGIDEDAEEVGEENPYATLVPENESLYIDDPKKALKGFYEREGCDLPDYQFTDGGIGKHKCRLELPVDGPNGEELVAEAVVTGKKKDAVVACALEACRILDRLGLLRASSHESRKRKQKKWEDDDFYDSDEDTFLDRTGTIEKKRFIRMKNAGKSEPETYESLLEKYNTVAKQIEEIEGKLQKAKEEADARASEEMDELEAYMVSIKAGAMDTKTRIQLKGELLRLRAEEQRLRRLVNIAKPASLPPLKPSISQTSPNPTPTADSLSRKLHAQQKQQKKPTLVKIPSRVPVQPVSFEEVEEEEEEEEEEDDTKEAKCDQQKPVKPQSHLPAPKTDESLNSSGKLKPTAQSASTFKGPSRPPSEETDTRHGRNSKPPHHLSTAAVLNALEKKQSAQKGKPVTDSKFEPADPDYAMWLPPEEQSGDGRTSLNDKLGY
ncbi:unnamed protein product [Candidula unifasciata]|uniref:FHA domain-containing protein n=1 Tax=Candidula unifasciata TaxID=100452 RepID=A0A8S3ZJI5_9EUPU|nr:unnamed protein product [Candidula unifasciata]